jgi:hypothetical protein
MLLAMMQQDKIPSRLSRRAILRGSMACLAAPLLDKASTAYGLGAESQVSIVVGKGDAGMIGPQFCGLSYEKSLLAVPFFSRRNQRAVGLFKRLGPGNLRIGGNSVDKTHWAASGNGHTAGQIAPADVDALAVFLNATDWTVLYGVNLATSTPALAAEEVAYAAKVLGDRLTGIEIGNEPDGYAGDYFGKEWSPARNIALWSQFADAISRQTPNVALSGPGIESLNHVNNWTASFAEVIAPQRKQLKLLTQHYYRADGHSPSATMHLLLSPDPNLSTALKQLQTLSQQSGVPFRFTEANSFYNGGMPGVSNACGSALWALDLLFQLAAAGAAGVNFQDGGNFTRGYTVISHEDAIIYGPQPVYYGLLLFTLAGTGKLRPVSFSAGGWNITAYAVESSSGALSVVVINKDASKTITASIQVARLLHSARIFRLTMPSLIATDGIMIQSAVVEKDGSFSPQPSSALEIAGDTVSLSLRAASAALIQIT